MNKKIGFTIGKFAPLHKGHQYMIELMLKEMDSVIVVVYDTDVIRVPVNVRANWIKSLYPKVEVLLAYDSPKQYGLDEKSVSIQMKYLLGILGDIKPTHFYSSEPYGASVAQYMNIVDRRVDNLKEIMPISATVIRSDIEVNKKWIDTIVYEDLKKYHP